MYRPWRIQEAETWQRDTYPHASFERDLLPYLERILPVIEAVGATPPVAVCLTLTDVRGMQMANNFGKSHEIQDDHLVLPEVMLDLIWNALGYEKSTNFDADGNWVSRGF